MSPRSPKSSLGFVTLGKNSSPTITPQKPVVSLYRLWVEGLVAKPEAIRARLTKLLGPDSSAAAACRARGFRV